MKSTPDFIGNVCTQAYKHLNTISMLFVSLKFQNYTHALEKSKTRQNISLVFLSWCFHNIRCNSFDKHKIFYELSYLRKKFLGCRTNTLLPAL